MVVLLKKIKEIKNFFSIIMKIVILCRVGCVVCFLFVILIKVIWGILKECSLYYNLYLINLCNGFFRWVCFGLLE